MFYDTMIYVHVLVTQYERMTNTAQFGKQKWITQ